MLCTKLDLLYPHPPTATLLVHLPWLQLPIGEAQWRVWWLTWWLQTRAFIPYSCLTPPGPWVDAQQSRSCPKYCPKSNEPVCGSDKVIYSNECFLQKANCDSDVVVAEPQVCTRAKGSLCENRCTSEEDPVCGSDGRTYLNTCVMMVEECRRGIRLAHMGPCINETVVEEECPQSCEGAPVDGPICASNGNVYPSRCALKLQTCKQGVVETKEKHCLLTKYSKDSCWRASKAVCGSNGQIYASSCLLRKQSSLTGKYVFEVPMTYCALQERSANNCAFDCLEDENASPVCGSDGNIYSSLCQMRKLNCLGQTNGKVIVVEWLRCAAKAMRCADITCKSNATQGSQEELYCGNDGQTYTDCELKVAACRRSTELAHIGPCTNLTEEETASCAAISCPEDDQDDEPVCASNGNVYRSLCEMERQTCGQHVIAVARKHCQMTKFCGHSCSKKSQSVCGSDLKIYRNLCTMFANNCGRFVYEVPMKRCLAVAGFHFTGCNRICPSEYDPVCGSDNKTYSNECFLELEHCRSRSLVTKKHYGKCGEPVPEPKAYLY